MTAVGVTQIRLYLGVFFCVVCSSGLYLYLNSSCNILSNLWLSVL